jgi:uncharacterized phage infection (PIP) family protein YhgE
MVEEEREPQRKPATSREILDELMDWSGKVFQKVKEEADTLSTKGKLTIDVTTLKSKRGSEFKRLGEKVYRLLGEGKYDISELEDDMARIDNLAEEIRDRERQLKEVGRKADAETDTENEVSVEDTEEIEEETED